jgi:hypothetical protein
MARRAPPKQLRRSWLSSRCVLLGHDAHKGDLAGDRHRLDQVSCPTSPYQIVACRNPSRAKFSPRLVVAGQRKHADCAPARGQGSADRPIWIWRHHCSVRRQKGNGRLGWAVPGVGEPAMMPGRLRPAEAGCACFRNPGPQANFEMKVVADPSPVMPAGPRIARLQPLAGDSDRPLRWPYGKPAAWNCWSQLWIQVAVEIVRLRRPFRGHAGQDDLPSCCQDQSTGRVI